MNYTDKASRTFAWVSDHIIASIIIVGLFLFGIGYVGHSLSSWWFERGVEQADDARDKIKGDVTEDQKASEAELGMADATRDVAEEKEEQLLKTKKKVKELKSNAEKLDKKAADAGRNDINDSDVPSNAELCARANSLGVRCDSDK
jgi:hypothetical protein